MVDTRGRKILETIVPGGVIVVAAVVFGGPVVGSYLAEERKAEARVEMAANKVSNDAAAAECRQVFNNNAPEINADMKAQVEDHHAASATYRFDEIFTVDDQNFNCDLQMDGNGNPVLNMTLQQ